MRGRAALAVLLTIGFYGLALGIAGVLLFVVWLFWVNGHGVNRFSLFCLIGAGVILWSILPRPQRFEAPGPTLQAAEHPRLFAELTDVATRVGEPMPHEVYLVPDVNAGVRERGGLMGIGGRRVMLLGLPLLTVLTISQMRAVLAHEFGHYHGGDTRIAPWVYRTREAIIRTIRHLSGSSSVLHLPFVWYGNLFLRVTQAISRRQEYLADALAARTVGARSLIDGLRIIFGAAEAYPSYWRSEIVPVLSAGYLPPIADGFDQFLRQPAIVDEVTRITKEEMTAPNNDPLDSHPSLPDRIKALNALPPGPEPPADPMALSLLADGAAMERGLGASLMKPGTPALRPLAWDDVGIQVLIPSWEGRLKQDAQLLSGQTVADLPSLAPPSTSDETFRRARTVSMGAALAVALASAGWSVDALPGAPPILRRASDIVEPFRVAQELASGELSAQAWGERCTALGIGELRLNV